MSDLALRLIAENKKTKATTLDLGNCGLTELPEEVLDCVWLEELILGRGWWEIGWTSNPIFMFKTQPSLSHVRTPILRIPDRQPQPQSGRTTRSQFLTSLLRNEPQTRLLLSKRLQELAGQPAAIARAKPRTLRELLDIEVVVSDGALERHKREAAEKRRLKLEDMKNRESDIWDQVWQNLYKKTSIGYTLATTQISDLRDLADYTGEQDSFKENLLKILEQFGKSKAFMDRLKAVKLV